MSQWDKRKELARLPFFLKRRQAQPQSPPAAAFSSTTQNKYYTQTPYLLHKAYRRYGLEKPAFCKMLWFLWRKVTIFPKMILYIAFLIWVNLKIEQLQNVNDCLFCTFPNLVPQIYTVSQKFIKDFHQVGMSLTFHNGLRYTACWKY